MRRLLTLVALLSFPAAALANPVAPQSLPPDAPLLGAYLVEVAIVTALLWKCRLRLSVFIPCWYFINLLSFYVLMPVVANLYSVFHLYDMPISR
jgi:succinate-acetate transporter protein